jgi:hypothetical protein
MYRHLIERGCQPCERCAGRDRELRKARDAEDDKKLEQVDEFEEFVEQLAAGRIARGCREPRPPPAKPVPPFEIPSGCVPLLGVETDLHKLVTSSPEAAVIREFKDRPEQVHSRNAKGESPLMTALTSVKCSREVVAALLEIGSDANAEDAYGRTPLHAAAWINDRDGSDETDEDKDEPDLISLLVEGGGDVSRRDHLGTGRLMSRCSASIRGSLPYWRRQEATSTCRQGGRRLSPMRSIRARRAW